MNPFEQDNFAKHLGIELLDHGSGWAKARLAIGPRHHNALGVVHNGAIYALTVWTMAVAANTEAPVSVGIQANITYLETITEGTLTAHARAVSTRPKISAYRVEVSDDHSRLIATLQGLTFTKSTDRTGS
ncbi:MAG: PaaI family thioesterase [Sedimentisphaerales bacterium]|nr:PaaI family thioesterase [Sedimentisphaerales bacterium]